MADIIHFEGFKRRAGRCAHAWDIRFKDGIAHERCTACNALRHPRWFSTNVASVNELFHNFIDFEDGTSIST